MSTKGISKIDPETYDFIKGVKTETGANTLSKTLDVLCECWRHADENLRLLAAGHMSEEDYHASLETVSDSVSEEPDEPIILPDEQDCSPNLDSEYRGKGFCVEDGGGRLLAHSMYGVLVFDNAADANEGIKRFRDCTLSIQTEEVLMGPSLKAQYEWRKCDGITLPNGAMYQKDFREKHNPVHV